MCQDGFLSLDKGKECTVDSDCRSSQKQKIECRCGMDGSGKKYCGLAPDDDEWISARKTFSKYLAETVYCHPVRRLEDCGHIGEYKNW